MMFFVDNPDEHDPAVNLALEEHLMAAAPADQDLLLLYVNAPSVIVGRHQNVLEEVNLDYAMQHGIQVVRRLSGGGTVYHDLGNLNFSFITSALPENVRNFKKFTGPAVQALAALGIPAVLSGRSDLMVDGRKISGNAQHITKGRMVSHGTLLFNSDLSCVSEALKVQAGQITSRSIKSVRSRVANISEFLSRPMDISAFRAHLLAYIFPDRDRPPVYALTAADWSAVYRLASERYRSWEWTYGRSPDFIVEKAQTLPGGAIVARLEIQQGLIHALKLSGSFFDDLDPQVLERQLAGVRYTRADILRALQQEAIQCCFPTLEPPTLAAILY